MSNNAPLPFGAARAPGERQAHHNARLDNLRRLLHFERHANASQRQAMEALDREMLEMAGEPISARMNRRDQGLEAQSNEHDTVATPQIPPTGSPMALQRRRRIVRPSERLARIRRTNDPVGNIADAMEETSTSLSRPPPPVEPSDIALQEYIGEAQFHRETRWRATKRRKLDDGTHDDGANTFSYGHNGQVVAGPLRLEIVSCDGGAYSEPHIGSSWPQNVLQDDTSVYCTKSNRCNMLLKHVGGMPFSLTKLVIKAPRNGYDAPIQEGMVFVSMDEDKMLERTAPYEIRYSPKKSRELSRREENHIRFGPSREYLNSVRSPPRSIDRSSYLRDPYPLHDIQDTEAGMLDADLVPDFDVSTTYDNHSDNEASLQRSPRMRRLSASYYTDPDRNFIHPVGVSDYYRPTYHDTDNEDDSQESASSTHDSNPDLSRHLSARTYPDPLHPSNARQRRLLQSRHIEHAYDVHAVLNHRDIQDDFSRAYRQLESGQSEYPSRRLRTRPSRIEVRPEPRRQDTPDVQILPAEQNELYGPPSNETNNAATPLNAAKTEELDVLKPHARFFIRRDKSSVSINFEPPVAGRYILIKLWAPCPNANIDIQTVVAHGYGGPRFFPAYEPH